MTTWVFLRGLMREQRHWGRFPADFHREIGDAKIVTLDLPGNGVLYREASPTRIEEMAQYCREELAARQLAPPYHMLALSLGAMVAVAWCAQHADEIGACVLINTSLRPFSPFYRRLRPQNYLKLLRSLHTDLKQREQLILHLTSCHGNAQIALADEWVSFQREFPVSRRNVLRQLYAAARFVAPLRKPQPPILVLGSLQDRLVDTRCSQSLVHHWHTDSAFHPQAGHDLPLDDGPWVARQVRTWLESKEIARQQARFGSSVTPEVIIDKVPQINLCQKFKHVNR
jgi:pimeloyl-ACP methyl ester carboxylesterase